MPEAKIAKELSEIKLYLALILILLVATVGWFVIVQSRETKTITFVIPPGTAQQLEAGNEVITFPNELAVTVGDTIIIDNQDDAVHAFGPFTILPHTTLTKRFESVRTYQNACTFHQDKSMTIAVQSSSWDIFQ